MNLWRKYFALPVQDKLLLFKTLALSLFVKLVVKLLPLRWYSSYLNYTTKTEFQGNSKSREEILDRIRIAVSRCSRYAPWSTKCLVDAITAKLLLRFHHINSTLYLGVSKDANKKLIAHAWLKCDDLFITGKKGYRNFTVVSSFT